MDKNTLEIPMKGKKIIGKAKRIKIDQIKFDEDNPRISMGRDSQLIGSGVDHIDQKMIGYLLKTQSSYKDLKNAIRDAGGATQPIWVYPISEDKYSVIEGNTRLKIHQDLKDEEGEQYAVINCWVLPTKIDEELKDYLRLQCHLRGKTDWDKYEQAKYLYRLYEKENYPAKELSRITKLSPSEILQDIEAFKIMDQQFREKYEGKTDIVDKFSYFKEFVKNTKLQDTMEELKLTEMDFCDWVGERRIERAMDVRKLNEVLVESESLEIFLKKDLEKAWERLKELIPEKSDKIYRIMTDLAKKIGSIELDEVAEIQSKNSEKRKIVENLGSELKKLLGK
jgi:hypothetical protein